MVKGSGGVAVDKRVGYVLRRAMILVIGIMVVLSMEFLVLRVMPGDPMMLALPRNPSMGDLGEYMNEITQIFSEPLMVQYVQFVGDMLSGDFGPSLPYQDDVSGFIYDHLGRTLVLFFASLSVCFLFAPLLSRWISRLRSHTSRQLASLLPLAAFSVTVVAWSWLLRSAFVIGVELFPSGGYMSTGGSPEGAIATLWDYLSHAALPVIVISLAAVGALILAMRDGHARASEAAQQGRARFIDGVFAGLPNVQFAVAGAMCFVIVVETTFHYRGLGFLLVDSIERHDYFAVQASFFLISLVVFLTNYIIELMVTLLRPKGALDTYLNEEGAEGAMPSATVPDRAVPWGKAAVVSVVRGYMKSPVGLVALAVLLGIVVLAAVGPYMTTDEITFPYIYSSTDLFLEGAGPLVTVSIIVGLVSAVLGVIVGVLAGLFRPLYLDSVFAGAAQGLLAIPLVAIAGVFTFATVTYDESGLSVAQGMAYAAAGPVALLVLHGFVSSRKVLGPGAKGAPSSSRASRHWPAVASWALGGLKYVVPMSAIAVFATDALGLSWLGSWGRAIDIAYSFHMELTGGWEEYVLPSFVGMFLLVGSTFLVLDTLERVVRTECQGRA